MSHKLLKDLPEHAARIEDSYLLKESIKDQLSDIEVDTDLDDEFEDECISKIVSELREATFIIEDGRVAIEDRQTLAIAIYKSFKQLISNQTFNVVSSTEIAENIRESVSDFVNENYTWKGESAK